MEDMRVMRVNQKARGWLAVALAALCALPGVALAELDSYRLGNGQDGHRSVTEVGTIVNRYTQVNSPLAPGDTSVPVVSTTGFEAGDLVLVFQTTGFIPVPASGSATSIDLSSEPVGRWELARVSAVAAGRLELSVPLVYSYAASVTQVVWVPEYASVTIAPSATLTGKAWDGKTGGIIALLVQGTVTNSGSIDASGLGFRGGAPSTDGSTTACTGLDEAAPRGAEKGEGLASVTLYGGSSNTGRGNIANGAGGGVCSRSGGGGGGNRGAGGKGGRSSTVDGARDVGGLPGVALSYSPRNRLVLGGGGGGGHGTGSNTLSGGAGGGIVFLRAGSMAGTGTILAEGGSVSSPTSPSDGASGGGAGGTLYLRFTGQADCTRASARGGAGGNTYGGTSYFGPGGGGGGGAIYFQAPSGTCPLNSANHVAGTTQDGSGPYGLRHGATSGASGVSETSTTAFTVPATPSITAPAQGQPIRTLTINGALQSAGTVIAYVDGTEVGRTTLSASGNFSISGSATLTEGSHQLRLIAVHEDSWGDWSGAVTFLWDVTPPAAPVVTSPSQGAFINTARPQIRGTADAGSVVSVYFDGVLAGTAPVDASGSWSYTASSDMYELHQVKARATDRSGNVGAFSGDVSFTVDVSTPAAPTLTAPLNGVAVNTSTPAIQGTGEKGATIIVLLNGTESGRVTANASTGNWIFVPAALSDGTYTLAAQARDLAGKPGSHFHGPLFRGGYGGSGNDHHRDPFALDQCHRCFLHIHRERGVRRLRVQSGRRCVHDLWQPQGLHGDRQR